METNPYLNPSATPPFTSEFTQPTPPPRAPWWKTFLASVALGLGLLFGFAGILSGDLLTSLFWGVAISLPGVWWFLHQKREQRGSTPLNRHWGVIALISFLLFVFGSLASPSNSTDQQTDPAMEPASSSETSPAQPTSSSSEPSENDPSSEEATEASSKSAIEEPNSSSSIPVRPDDEDDTEKDRPYVPPAHQPAPIRQQPVPSPRPVPAPAPKPAYEPPATGGGFVHPGAFCSGGSGVSKTGKAMVCAPGADGKNRWRSAG